VITDTVCCLKVYVDGEKLRLITGDSIVPAWLVKTVTSNPLMATCWIERKQISINIDIEGLSQELQAVTLSVPGIAKHPQKLDAEPFELIRYKQAAPKLKRGELVPVQETTSHDVPMFGYVGFAEAKNQQNPAGCSLVLPPGRSPIKRGGGATVLKHAVHLTK
jgi:hypothetical protein